MGSDDDILMLEVEALRKTNTVQFEELNYFKDIVVAYAKETKYLTNSLRELTADFKRLKHLDEDLNVDALAYQFEEGANIDDSIESLQTVGIKQAELLTMELVRLMRASARANYPFTGANLPVKKLLGTSIVHSNVCKRVENEMRDHGHDVTVARTGIDENCRVVVAFRKVATSQTREE